MTIIDMHLHIRYRSRCSNLSPMDVANNLSERIDGICVTDHWVLEPKNIDFHNHDLKVFYGVEIGCEFGDILAYGMKWIPLKRRMIKAEYIIDILHKQGAIVACAHPFSNRHEGFGDNIYDFNFDAVEINGALTKEFNQLAKKAANVMDIPTIGGSDAHSARQLNTIGTKFEVLINSMDDIVEAIRKKECTHVKI